MSCTSCIRWFAGGAFVLCIVFPGLLALTPGSVLAEGALMRGPGPASASPESDRLVAPGGGSADLPSHWDHTQNQQPVLGDLLRACKPTSQPTYPIGNLLVAMRQRETSVRLIDSRAGNFARAEFDADPGKEFLIAVFCALRADATVRYAPENFYVVDANGMRSTSKGYKLGLLSKDLPIVGDFLVGTGELAYRYRGTADRQVFTALLFAIDRDSTGLRLGSAERAPVPILEVGEEQREQVRATLPVDGPTVETLGEQLYPGLDIFDLYGAAWRARPSFGVSYSGPYRVQILDVVRSKELDFVTISISHADGLSGILRSGFSLDQHWQGRVRLDNGEWKDTAGVLTKVEEMPGIAGVFDYRRAPVSLKFGRKPDWSEPDVVPVDSDTWKRIQILEYNQFRIRFSLRLSIPPERTLDAVKIGDFPDIVLREPRSGKAAIPREVEIPTPVTQRLITQVQVPLPVVQLPPPVVQLPPPVIQLPPPVIQLPPPVIQLPPPTIPLPQPVVQLAASSVRMPSQKDADAQEYDLTGDWSGTAEWEGLTFTISFSVDAGSRAVSNLDVSAKCRTGTGEISSRSSEASPIAADGGFAFTAGNGSKGTGKFISARTAEGSYATPVSLKCGDAWARVSGTWTATKKGQRE